MTIIYLSKKIEKSTREHSVKSEGANSKSNSTHSALSPNVFIICPQGLLLPEPTYKGPENIVYFRDNNFTEEISRDKNVVWMVTFYAAWSPACIDFASIFSKISSEYGLPNLKFGKVSVIGSNNKFFRCDLKNSEFFENLP